MLKIKLFKKDGTPLAMFETYLDLEIEKNLNDGGKGKISFDYKDKHINNETLKLANQIEIYYIGENKQVYNIFKGFVYSFVYTETKIDLYFIDFLEYSKFRILREDKSYNQAIKNTISDLWNYFNGIYELPFSLGKNDIDDVAEFSFKAGQNLLDILKSIIKISGEFRILWDKLDFSKQTGENKLGVFKYDVNDLYASNIEKYTINFGLSNFTNSLLIGNGDTKTLKQDTVSIDEIGIWEKYVYSPDTDQDLGFYLQNEKIPNILVSNKINWVEYAIGDRQRVVINPGFDYLSLDFIGLISKQTIRASGGVITCEFKTPERYLTTLDLGNYLKQLDGRIGKLEV